MAIVGYCWLSAVQITCSWDRKRETCTEFNSCRFSKYFYLSFEVVNGNERIEVINNAVENMESPNAGWDFNHLISLAVTSQARCPEINMSTFLSGWLKTQSNLFSY